MGRGFHVGTFLIFAAFVLLLVSTITSPVTTDIGLFHVQLTNSSTIRRSSLNFGVLGYTLLDGAVAPGTRPDQDFNSPRSLGYDLTGIISSATGVSYTSNSINNATKALVLHPIATGLAFLAFLIAVLSSRLGYLVAAFVAFIAFLVSLIAMALDFAIFGPVKNAVNSSGSGAVATYSTGIWLTLAATIILFFASIATCFACVTERRTKRTTGLHNNDQTYGNGKY